MKVRSVRCQAAALVLAFTTLLTACKSGTDDVGDYEFLRVQIDGQPGLGVSKKGQKPKALVVFFHGLDADESILRQDEMHTRLTETLVDAGYAVVASRAGGNAFGNAASRHNYAEVAKSGLTHYGVKEVFFLAESMGAIAAVDILASTPHPGLRGLAAVSPALDLNAAGPNYEFAVKDAFTTETLESANPMNLPAHELLGKRIRFYATPTDTVIPTPEHAIAFQQRYGSNADITIVPCTGDHLDSSCIQPNDIVQWFDSLDKE